MAAMAPRTTDDDLGKRFADGSIDLTELNEQAAAVGAAATTAESASSSRDGGAKLAPATPPKS